MRLARPSLLLATVVALAPSGACHRSAPPACNAIVNRARPVPFTAVPGALPALTGGAVEDGVYEAVRAEGYGGATPSGRRMTLVVRNGGAELAWAGDLLDPTGSTATASVRANATAVVSGNRLRLTTTCSSIAPSPLPDTMAFSASPGKLRLAFVDGGAASVTTYARRADPSISANARDLRERPGFPRTPGNR